MSSPIRLPEHTIRPADTDATLVTKNGRATWETSANVAFREVLMASGVTSPPEPLESSDGTDWLYGYGGGGS